MGLEVVSVLCDNLFVNCFYEGISHTNWSQFLRISLSCFEESNSFHSHNAFVEPWWHSPTDVLHTEVIHCFPDLLMFILLPYFCQCQQEFRPQSTSSRSNSSFQIHQSILYGSKRFHCCSFGDRRL